MIGCGSMGGGLALLFAENGVNVSLSDPSEETMDGVIKKAQKSGYHNRVRKYKGTSIFVYQIRSLILTDHADYGALCDSLSRPRLLVFSLPHGNIGDKVLDGLMPHLSPSDIILDCGNEHFANTERRQQKSQDAGVKYIGCGVSGGYQAARAGPSMCPGADESALREVMPLLEKVAAKDQDGRPCVGPIGNGGAGHYVKMIHNGIEHGMMSAICEAWGIMQKIGLGREEIGDIFSKWNESGEFVSTLSRTHVSVAHKRAERDLPHFHRRRSVTQTGRQERTRSR